MAHVPLRRLVPAAFAPAALALALALAPAAAAAATAATAAAPGLHGDVPLRLGWMVRRRRPRIPVLGSQEGRRKIESALAAPRTPPPTVKWK